MAPWMTHNPEALEVDLAKWAFTNSPKLEDHRFVGDHAVPIVSSVWLRELPEVYEGLCHVGLYSSFIVEV